MRSIVFLFLYAFTALSQNKEVVDAIQWSNAGLKLDFVKQSKALSFDDIGGVADGKTANDAILKKIFQTYPDGREIQFSEGVYYFEERIQLPGNFVLKGAGIDKTTFVFNLEKEHDLILTQGQKTVDTVFFEQGVNRFDESILIQENSTLKAGDWIILGDNDKDFVHSNWAWGKSGQIIKIEKIDGDKIFLEGQLRRDYHLQNKPYAVKLLPAEGAGIENLSLKRRNQTKLQTSNIQFRFAVNCWVNNVRSDSTNYAHVLLEYAANCEVKNSHFAYGYDYGAGGKAYGVVLQFATSECAIMYNHFNHLRHAMLLQAGANGNVIIENESDNPYWKEPFLPKRAAGDLVLHGNYPYVNFFERNRIQNLVIDDSHGINGPYNVFALNKVESYGIIMGNSPATDSLVFVGNEVSGKGIFKGKYRLKGNGHFEFANRVKRKAIPKGTRMRPDYGISIYRN